MNGIFCLLPVHPFATFLVTEGVILSDIVSVMIKRIFLSNDRFFAGERLQGKEAFT
jgi:hypothetical protein